MNLNGLKVLVTGGAGFIGSHVVDVLVREGCQVRVIDNLANGRLENIMQHEHHKSFQFYKGDIINSSHLDAALKEIEVVFHMACLGVRHSLKHPFENHRINAEGTLLTLQESLKAGVKKFIFISSSEVYGTADYVPMPENHPTRPTTIYGASKLAGEAYTRAYYWSYGLDTVIIRPFNTYGPRSHHEGDAGELIPKSIVRALNDRPILVFGTGTQTRDFTYVEDIARGIVDASKFELLKGQTVNIGSDSEISITRVAELILEITGKNASSIEYKKNRPGDIHRLYSDSSFFRKVTGWKPEVSFSEGLLKTIRWFQEKPEGLSARMEQETGVNWE